MNRPGPYIVDNAAIALGAQEAQDRINDYNENHDPKTGQFGEGTATASGGNAMKSGVANQFKYAKAFWPTPSAHTVALAAAKTKEQLGHELAALAKNTNLNKEYLGKVVEKYTLKPSEAKTKEGMMKEISSHWFAIQKKR